VDSISYLFRLLLLRAVPCFDWYIYNYTGIFVYLNSAFNPFLYAVGNTEVKALLMRAITTLMRKRWQSTSTPHLGHVPVVVLITQSTCVSQVGLVCLHMLRKFKKMLSVIYWHKRWVLFIDIYNIDETNCTGKKSSTWKGWTCCFSVSNYFIVLEKKCLSIRKQRWHCWIVINIKNTCLYWKSV